MEPPIHNERILELSAKWREGTITEDELKELEEWYAKNQDASVEIPYAFASSEKEHSERILRAIKEKAGIKPKLVRMQPWKRWAVAASIILIIGITAVVGLLTNNHKGNTPTAQSVTDVSAPTNTRAVITLANGSKVYLDSAGNGILAQENNVNVVRNADGIISYELNRTSASLSAGSDVKTQGATAYNTLFNPRGSKVISLTLSDGTKVWLNSESSLRYPASFASTAVREVEITGEAYFEVKHNAKQPFKVHLPNGGIVEDLGTSFNINSYSDESDIKTTLIEGSVRIFANSASSAVKLKPGEQAVLNQANPKISRIEVQTNIDTEEVTAWKNGLFRFNNTNIQSIMQQVKRWYDVEVVYQLPTENLNFSGFVGRKENISQLLKIMELTGLVHFKIEGKKIIVMK